MIARVIHFGLDDCHRLMVLRSAGYAVENCASLLQLRTVLDTCAGLDAMLLSDSEGVAPREAVAIARKCSSLPLILFRNNSMAYEESGFDLVVDCLTPPELWLNELNSLIVRKRTEFRA